MMVKFNCIERPLSKLFYLYGNYICSNPLPFIFLPILFTLTSSIGFISLESITDAIYLFTPINAQSKMERQIIHDLWPLVNGSYIPGRAVTQSREVQITVSAKGGGNVLDKPYSEAVYMLDEYIQKKIKVSYGGRTYGYHDLCLSWRNQGCPGNKHVHAISDLYQHGINVTYPTIHIGTINAYIGASLGGVRVAYGQNDNMILASANSWLMIYHLQFYPQNISYISGLWEKEFQRKIKSYGEKDPYLTITYFHSQTLAEELKRNADSLIPRFVLAFSILILFSVICNLSTCHNGFYIDWVVSKPVLAIFGVINAGMGIATAVGILNLLSVPYNDIVGVMPFLVVAVGVDNMFLMVAAIRRTNRASNANERVGQAMSDAAVSMLITALTDALSFGVGTITSIPAVQIFCIYTCVALTITFIYQFTFFSGLLALAIKWEEIGLHCVFLTPTVPEDLRCSTSLLNRIFCLGSRSDPDPSNLARNVKETNAAFFFQNWFAPILMQPLIRALVIIWYLIYILFAVYGCTQLKEGLEPVNLLVEDSYAVPHYRALEQYFWHYGATLQIVVNNVPNLADPDERLRIKSMVHSFANSKHAIGDQSVQFWLFEMERYYSEIGISLSNISIEHSFYGLAFHFISAKNTEFWPEDIVWDVKHSIDGIAKIKSFRFLIGMRDISTSVEQEDATRNFRQIASHFPRFNVTTFMPLWLFTDQYALVIPNTIQNIVIAMIVMIIIAFLLIPQPMCAFWVALAIASIDLGIIGYMTLWNVNLDAISMITIIMSIGFSVDYSAHITYGYVCSRQEAPRHKIQEALGALGWPLTQGAISTILAVVVLANVPAYMIVTFFKTVFLAIALGLLHGLVFLPVILALFVRGFCTATITDVDDKVNVDLNTTLNLSMSSNNQKS